MCNWADCWWVALSKSLLKFFSGTGTNAAYVEAANNVENFGKMPGSATLVAINAEWGGVRRTQ